MVAWLWCWEREWWWWERNGEGMLKNCSSLRLGVWGWLLGSLLRKRDRPR